MTKTSSSNPLSHSTDFLSSKHQTLNSSDPIGSHVRKTSQVGVGSDSSIRAKYIIKDGKYAPEVRILIDSRAISQKAVIQELNDKLQGRSSEQSTTSMDTLLSR